MAGVYLTPDAEAHLALYGPSTYGIALPREIAAELQEAGLVEWIPGPAWSGTIDGLTDAGAMHLDDMLGERRP